MEEVLALCRDGRISPPVALARLVLAGFGADEIAANLQAGSDLARLFAAQRGRLAGLAEMLRASGTDHGTTSDGSDSAPVGAIAAMFDRAVALQPEASVAAYSLGDGALLAAATDELIAWLRTEGLVRTDAAVLDLGCGFGRVAGALAPYVGSVLGLDVSPGMVAEAQRRWVDPKLRFAVTDGRPPTDLLPASFDLALAVDSMPYLVQAGIAEAHVAEARRLLRAGGSLAVFNLSYRDDAADAADAQRWAERYGLRLIHCGTRPFRLWDGAAYVFTVAH